MFFRFLLISSIDGTLSLCDIQSFDPDLGRILLEFKALVNRQKCESACGDNTAHVYGLRFRCTKIEDLCLDYTLPGYPEYVLSSGMDDLMVNINNLEEYISFVLHATLQTGISRQVEAFKSGLNQAISDKHLQLFTEEELERLLCGEHDSWLSVDLFDHIKFDHGYTAGSTPIINLLEVISEFTYEQRRAFLQFVTGAHRLPPGGLAALNPKLTIVRKVRNKPIEPPKKPEKAPFFLPSVPSLSGDIMFKPSEETNEELKDGDAEQNSDYMTNILASPFLQVLQSAVESKNFSAFTDYIKGLSPSFLDMELRMIQIIDDDDESSRRSKRPEMLSLEMLLDYLIYEISCRNNFEFVQAVVRLFLKGRKIM